MDTLLLVGLGLLGLAAVLALIWFLLVAFGAVKRKPKLIVQSLPVPALDHALPSGSTWVAAGFEAYGEERDQRGAGAVAVRPVALRGRFVRDGSFTALDVALLSELGTPVLSQAVQGDGFEFVLQQPEGRYQIQLTAEGRGSLQVILESVGDARADGLPIVGPLWKVMSPVTFHVPSSVSLEQAFRQAQPRDTIAIDEGFYLADGLLPVSEVVIRGKGMGRTFLLLRPGRIPLHDVRIEDVTLFDTSAGKTEIAMSGDVHVWDTEIVFLEGPALTVRGDVHGDVALTLSRSVVHVTHGPLVRMAGPVGNIDIRDNELIGHEAVVDLVPGANLEGFSERILELGERIRENNRLLTSDIRPVIVSESVGVS